MTAMESSYGIAVKNKFDLFLDEEADPLEILQMQEEAKNKKKDGGEKTKKDVKSKDNKAKKSAPKTKAPTPQQTEKPRISDDKENRRDTSDKPYRNKSRQGDNQQRDGGERGYRGPANRDRDLPPRRRENRDNREQYGGDFGGFGGPSSPPTDYRGGDRPESGRGRGGGRGRGRGGPVRGGGRFGKREFDRHSGSDKTGIKATDKRDGAGAGNWGTMEDDIQEQMNTARAGEAEDWAPTGEDSENKDPAEKTEGEHAEEGEDKEAKLDPEAHEMTLEEYRALQSRTAAEKTEFKIRKAGEGVDDKQWKKTYVLKKKPLESEDEEEEYESDEEDDHRQKKKTANNLIEITFSDQPRRGGRGRMAGGGRGGGGGRGRGGFGDRGGRERREGGRGRGGGRRDDQPIVNINDEADFPELH